MLRRTEDLYGFLLRGTDGTIGRIHDLYFDDGTWTVGYLALNTGAWPISDFVLLPPHVLKALSWDKRRGSVGLSREQVSNIPDIRLTPTLARQQCAELDAHFAWLARTTMESAPGKREIYSRTVAERRPVLQSARDVTDYRIEIEATEIGRVQDVLFDDETWLIRYLYVECWSWSPGRRELIPPECVVRVDRSEGKIFAVLQSRLAPTG